MCLRRVTRPAPARSIETLARAHGGQVQLHSSPGQGTTARLLLPAAQAETTPAAHLERST